MKLRFTFHWTARICGAMVGCMVFGVILSRALGPENSTSTISQQTATELFMLSAIAVSAAALLFGWHHESSGGAAATAGGTILLAAAVLSSELRPIWPLGVAFLIPGVLYLLSAHWPKGNQPTH